MSRHLTLRVSLAQVNLTVGDLAGNLEKIKLYIEKARGLGSSIVVFPELAITGYPPEDLLLKPKFIKDNIDTLKKLVKSSGDMVVICGFVDRDDCGLYNTAAVIFKNKLIGVYRKTHLPNYSVFDERRYFNTGSKPVVFKFGSLLFGVTICEDIWHDEGPLKEEAAMGASLIFNISASPYYIGKNRERIDAITSQAKENRVSIAYTNLVGGQDELVFDGQSMVSDKTGKILVRAESLKEDLLFFDIEIPSGIKKAGKKAILITNNPPAKNKILTAITEKRKLSNNGMEELYDALKLGLGDYVRKNHFKKVVVGLSGGIDSALVAALARDTLGKDNVIGVYMPSRYSSARSSDDAHEFAGNIGIEFMTIPIEDIFKSYLATLKASFGGRPQDITEENLQARVRGNLLMALSNKFGWLVLTTGNKSEMSTGYATLYGDMAGGFALLKDVTKTLVYKLAKYRNSLNHCIPESIINREPTAELRPNQKDQDTLPPYDVLDGILKAYVEEDKDLATIVSSGYDRDIVSKVLAMVDNSEYKRRQSPPGIKITPRAFGKDRRMPITNRYSQLKT